MESEYILEDTEQIKRMKKHALLSHFGCSGEIYKLLSLEVLHNLVKKIKKRSELSNEFLNSSQYKEIKSSVKVILSNYNLSSEMLEKAANDIINEILSSICNSCDDTYEDDVIINKGQVKIKNRKS